MTERERDAVWGGNWFLGNHLTLRVSERAAFDPVVLLVQWTRTSGLMALGVGLIDSSSCLILSYVSPARYVFAGIVHCSFYSPSEGR